MDFEAACSVYIRFRGVNGYGQGMLAQELQYPHVPSCAGHRAVEFFQRGAEVGEACRQRPVAEHRRMVERAGLRPSVAR